MSGVSAHARSQEPSPQVVKQAIQWSIRLNSQGHNSQLREQCEQWRVAHADHECAWQRIQALNSDFNSRFQNLPAPGAAIEALENSAQRLSRRQTLKLLSGLVVVGSSAWLSREVVPWQQWSADFATSVGQRGRFQLSDGSSLQLNTDSAVDQDFSAERRLITLNRGEILVGCGADVQSTTRRPLLVHSRHGLFEGISGRFVVRQYQDQTRISVLEGQSIIRSPAASPITVSAGQHYLVSSRNAVQLPALNMDAGAWSEGLIVTRNMRLRDFLTEVGAYRHGHLGCADDVADLRLSGVFRLEDTDKLLTVVTQTLPVQLRYRTRWWVTLQREV
ncbi:FecR domain-containing protein [Pseudomonas sp. Irchel 3A5]|uniref:FecR domain-containing protein n=1 Tax=Pseudomonas sp. Irchel 3A5 TaxID=2008911 RepID=UPI000BA31A61|nr:FecR family protein [Pseudomonas sp. Irchel 3A5]